MSRASCRKEHFDHDDDKDSNHCNEAGHGRIVLVPEIRETRVGHGDEGGGEQVDKGSRDENPCTEMSREKEESMRDGEGGKASSDDGKGACYTELAVKPFEGLVDSPRVLRTRIRNRAKT